MTSTENKTITKLLPSGPLYTNEERTLCTIAQSKAKGKRGKEVGDGAKSIIKMLKNSDFESVIMPYTIDNRVAFIPDSERKREC